MLSKANYEVHTYRAWEPPLHMVPRELPGGLGRVPRDPSPQYCSHLTEEWCRKLLPASRETIFIDKETKLREAK